MSGCEIVESEEHTLCSLVPTSGRHSPQQWSSPDLGRLCFPSRSQTSTMSSAPLRHAPQPLFGELAWFAVWSGHCDQRKRNDDQTEERTLTFFPSSFTDHSIVVRTPFSSIKSSRLGSLGCSVVLDVIKRR